MIKNTSKMAHFKNIDSLDQLRKEYHRLALQFHPDRGGCEETMKAINNEFEKLSKSLINANTDFSAARKVYENQVSEEIIETINKIIDLIGIDIEIIGSWVWLTGNTYPNREAIKEAGFNFSRQKSAWYWHAGDYRKRNGKMSSLDDVRDFWGSEKIAQRRQEEKSLA
jgi:curved DNA-binding protein CbpA